VDLVIAREKGRPHRLLQSNEIRGQEEAMADQGQSQVAPQQRAEGWKTGLTTAATIIVSLISGGAMGAFITHYYATRQTIVNYSINTTSLGAAEATKSVLPTLKTAT
jgi:hypothetical protein